MKKLNIVYKKVNELVPYKNNPRINDEAVKYVANSIKEFGFKVPIVIDKDNVIVAGHTRLKACKQLGIDEVPCIIADDLTDEQIKAYRLADNKVSERAQWDFDLLDNELNDILDIDMSQFDFNLEDMELEEEKEVVEDEVPEVPEEPKSKLGDIYQLGNHRLMCGDGTNEETIIKLMNNNKADLVFTDPPYGMKKEKDGILNDNLNYDDLLEFNKKWIPLTFKYSKDNGSWYCWGIDEPLMDIYSNILKPMIKEKKIAFRNLITWDKGSGEGQLSEKFRMYPIADEKCLFVMIGSESCQGFAVNQEDYSENMDRVRIYLENEIDKLHQMGLNDKKIANDLGYKDGRTVNHWYRKSQFALPTKENYEALREYGKKVLKQDYDFLKQDYDELRQDFYSSRSYFNNTHDNMNNVWHFGRVNGAEKENTGGHATPKPIALCSRGIESSSRENEIVLDLFGGSGSTLIACEQLNRKCYMMELNPHYVDVIIKRWENFTGKKAVKINDN